MADEKPRRTGGSRWKRPPTKVYEYNYDVGQHYYQPMIRHLDKKSSGVATELPGPKTFAERLAEDPLYGRSKPVNYRSSDYSPATPRRAVGETSSARRPSGGSGLKDTSLQDMEKEVDEFLARPRPRVSLPSVSDQIMESAGMKAGDKFFDDALAEIRSRRKPLTPDADEMNSEPFFFNKAAGRGGGSNMEDTLAKRRNVLRELDNELEKIDSGLEKFGISRDAAKAAKGEELSSSISARMSSSATSSLNVKKRSVQTTMTTETVRY